MSKVEYCELCWDSLDACLCEECKECKELTPQKHMQNTYWDTTCDNCVNKLELEYVMDRDYLLADEEEDEIEHTTKTETSNSTL